MTRTSTDKLYPQKDYNSETCDFRASTRPEQPKVPVTAPSLQSSVNRRQSEPSRQTVTRSESLKILSTKSPSIATATLIRRTSCGDEFANRQQQQQYRNHTVSYPRDTGRRYYVREREDSEDLLANLLNLRDLMLNQNVHVS